MTKRNLFRFRGTTRDAARIGNRPAAPMRDDFDLPAPMVDEFRLRARRMAIHPCELLDYLINREINRVEKDQSEQLRARLRAWPSEYQ